MSPPLLSDPRAARVNSFTPLHAAAMHGYDTVCEIPLRAGADADAQTQPQKYATLHSAAFAGHVEVIKVLLAHDGGSGKQRRLHCSKKSSVAGWRN